MLPGLLLLGLVWRVAERFEPGYGGPTAVIARPGHDGAAVLDAAVLARVRGDCSASPRSRSCCASATGPRGRCCWPLAGLLIGYAIASEYPLAFVAVVLGLTCSRRRDALDAAPADARAPAPTSRGGVVGIVPLLLYNHAAFHSWTHLAYSNIPQQQKGFFGISAPSLQRARRRCCSTRAGC